MRARLLTAACAAACTAALTAGCSAGSEDVVGTPGAASGGPGVASPDAASPAASPAPSAAAGTVIEVTYAQGKVTGVDARVPVAVGEQVVLRVSSDVAEEIHVHGYDLYVDIPAGGTGEIEFLADKPGSWEVELHEVGRPLFQLRVS